MRIYLDNNATTRPDPAVTEHMARVASEAWGNPSSGHAEGRPAAEALDEARRSLAADLGCHPQEVVLTSGGTEADVAAVIGLARARRAQTGARRLVASPIEHPAVTAALRRLVEEGFSLDWLPVGGDGLPRVEDARRWLGEDVALLAVMLANNETGAVLPVAELAAVAREHGVPVHCDAVNAYGKWPCRFDALGVDALALSGHKFHGPRGVGALLLRDGVPFEPIMIGGGHEGGRRSGTENVAGASALALAVRLAREACDAAMLRMRALTADLELGLRALSAGLVRHGPTTDDARLPNTLNVSLPGTDGSAIAAALDREGVAISTGAACHEPGEVGSHVLAVMKVSPEQARGALRISLSRETTAEEISEALKAFARALASVR